MSPNIGDYDGRTGLHLAAGNNNVEVVRFFLTLPGIDVDVVDKFGQTSLVEAIEHGAVECIDILVEAGATPRLYGHALNFSYHSFRRSYIITRSAIFFTKYSKDRLHNWHLDYAH